MLKSDFMIFSDKTIRVPIDVTKRFFSDAAIAKIERQKPKTNIVGDYGECLNLSCYRNDRSEGFVPNRNSLDYEVSRIFSSCSSISIVGSVQINTSIYTTYLGALCEIPFTSIPQLKIDFYKKHDHFIYEAKVTVPFNPLLTDSVLKVVFPGKSHFIDRGAMHGYVANVIFSTFEDLYQNFPLLCDVLSEGTKRFLSINEKLGSPEYHMAMYHAINFVNKEAGNGAFRLVLDY